MNNALNGARSGISVLFIYIFFSSFDLSFFSFALYHSLTLRARSVHTFVTHFIYLWHACASHMNFLLVCFQHFGVSTHTHTHNSNSGVVVDTYSYINMCTNTHYVNIFLWMGKRDVPFFTLDFNSFFKTLIHFAKSLMWFLVESFLVSFFSDIISLIELCVDVNWMIHHDGGLDRCINACKYTMSFGANYMQTRSIY